MTNEGNQDIIKSGTLNITKVGGFFAAFVAVVGPPVLKVFNVFPDTAKSFAALGVAAVIASAVIALAIMVSADLRARAAVTVAKIAKSPTSKAEAGGTAYVAPTGTSFAVTVSGDSDRFQVLALRWDPEEERVMYLTGREGERPQWRSEQHVQASHYAH